MRFIIAALSLAAVTSAWAADDSQEMLAKDKIQFGQLLIQLGNAELEVMKLKKENEDLKAPKAAPEKPNGHP